MALVTYLFGAGASGSVDAIPVVKDLPAKLQEFQAEVKKIHNVTYNASLQGKLDTELLALRNELIEQLEWLYTTLSNFASIDTLAKTLSVTSRTEELLKLKILMSIYFNYLELRGARDKRYNSFFANIIGTTWKELPPSVRILSWNYDFQFEYAFSHFSGERGSANSSYLNIKDRFGLDSEMENKFTIFKINGSASFELDGKNFLDPTSFLNSYTDIHHDLLKKFGTLQCILPNAIIHTVNPPRSRLCYAWENDRKYVPKIKESIRATNCLVVIGYSFPFFNRAVDKELIGDLKLSKVYIQDLYPEAAYERFLALRPDLKDKIEVLKNCEQFLIPNELGL